ncbi:MAG TPA: hypothetical protein V6D25_30330 [Leptolyngbyaceae cyanobacterium]
MNTHLTITEIQEIQELLQDDTQTQNALIILEKHHGDLEASFDDLWQEKFGKTDYGKGKSLLQITLNEIRAEICGDDGLQGKIKEYTKKP